MGKKSIGALGYSSKLINWHDIDITAMACINKNNNNKWGISPRVQEHPASLSSPAHLDQCASLQNHHVWAAIARSAGRMRPQTSSHPGWDSPWMPRGSGSCTELSKPRGSWRSAACTVRRESPTWPERFPTTWRSSASLWINSAARTQHTYEPDRTGRLPPLRLLRSPVGDSLPTLWKSAEFYTTARLHKSGPMGRGDAAWRNDGVRSNSCWTSSRARLSVEEEEEVREEEVEKGGSNEFARRI